MAIRRSFTNSNYFKWRRNSHITAVFQSNQCQSGSWRLRGQIFLSANSLITLYFLVWNYCFWCLLLPHCSEQDRGIFAGEWKGWCIWSECHKVQKTDVYLLTSTLICSLLYQGWLNSLDKFVHSFCKTREIQKNRTKSPFGQDFDDLRPSLVFLFSMGSVK